MKVEHLGTALADAVRKKELAGTTDSKSTKHQVFHIDEARGYALMRYPGSSYSCRGFSNYVPGYINLVWLDQLGGHRSTSVWNTSRDEDGTLTSAKADSLVAGINAAIDALREIEFNAWCIKNPGQDVSLSISLIGKVFEVEGFRCRERFAKYVKRFDGVPRNMNAYKSWTEAYGRRLAQKEKSDREEAKSRRAHEWMVSYDKASPDERLAMVNSLIR